MDTVVRQGFCVYFMDRGSRNGDGVPMIYAQMQMQMQLQMLIAALVKDTITTRRDIDADHQADGLDSTWRRRRRSNRGRGRIVETPRTQKTVHQTFDGSWLEQACARVYTPFPMPGRANSVPGLSQLVLAHSYANPAVATNEMPTRRNAKRASNCKF